MQHHVTATLSAAPRWRGATNPGNSALGDGERPDASNPWRGRGHGGLVMPTGGPKPHRGLEHLTSPETEQQPAGGSERGEARKHCTGVPSAPLVRVKELALS
mmetsp:Transcript_75857/g.220275  ORF Transcript_75857/g.220275 Transcript_75857/m.220275 type:complete len:102 (+) Transcript_75857:220-525(+)